MQVPLFCSVSSVCLVFSLILICCELIDVLRGMSEVSYRDVLAFDGGSLYCGVHSKSGLAFFFGVGYPGNCRLTVFGT